MTATAEKVVLIGLDGAAFPILEPLMRQGTMPILAGIMAGGAVGTMRSTAHALSPPAWASIITGREPGSHGIFDFVRVDHSAGHPAYSLISSADLRADTVFGPGQPCGPQCHRTELPLYVPAPFRHRLGGSGICALVLSGPRLPPQRAFPATPSRAGIDPRRLAVDWEMERTAVQGLQEADLARWVELHVEREEQWARILEHLGRTEPSDLTAVVFDGVDRIQHLCLHLIQAHPADLSPMSLRARDQCLRYFTFVDDTIGRIKAAAGPDSAIMIVSDHGSRQAGDRIFYANTWLAQQGFLRWSDGVPIDGSARLAMNGNAESTHLFDWDRTMAAALTSSSNAIIVHRALHRGEPGVAAEDHVDFCQDLAERLLGAIDPATGERIVDRVLLRDETFPGPYCRDAPDLTLQLRSPGFLSVLRGAAITATRPNPYGTHDPDGIFVAAGAGIAGHQRLPDLSVIDVTPTILQLLGLPVPDDVEGVVVSEALTPAARSRRAAPIRELVPAGAGDAVTEMDGAAEAEILGRLRMLGYLE